MPLNANEQQYIDQQCLLLLVASLGKAIIAFPITASILTALFWPYVDHTIMLLWLSAVVGVSVYRAIVHRAVSKNKISPLNYKSFLNHMLLLDFFSGFILGLCGYFLSDLPQNLQWLLIITAAIFSMNSVAVQSSIKISVLAFNLPLYLSFIFWLIVVGDLTYYVVAILMLIHAGFLFGHFKALHAYIFNSLKLTFSNQQLANDLAEKNTELIKINQQVKASSKAKSQFIADISHQIKEPLQGMVNGLTYSQKLANLSDINSAIKPIQSSGVVLLALLNDLIAVERLDSGQLIKEEKSFNVREYFDDLLALVVPNAAQKNLFLYCDINSDVSDEIITDPLKLRQIVLNLLANAIKYTSQGEVALSLSTYHVNNQIWLTIAVADTGCGIAEDKQQLIFQPFVRGESSLDLVGNGLGLAISHELTVLLGGMLSVISAVDKGAIFRCKLPIKVSSNELITPLLSKQKILLVEAHNGQCQSMVNQFNHLKMVVETCDHIKDAMAICASHNNKYQAVIVGHQDKLQQRLLINLCQRIKFPMILLADLNEKQQSITEQAEGLVQVLTYPVKLSALKHALNLLE